MTASPLSCGKIGLEPTAFVNGGASYIKPYGLPVVELYGSLSPGCNPASSILTLGGANAFSLEKSTFANGIVDGGDRVGAGGNGYLGMAYSRSLGGTSTFGGSCGGLTGDLGKFLPVARLGIPNRSE